MKSVIELLEEMSEDLQYWINAFGDQASVVGVEETREILERAGMVIQNLKAGELK